MPVVGRVVRADRVMSCLHFWVIDKRAALDQSQGQSAYGVPFIAATIPLRPLSVGLVNTGRSRVTSLDTHRDHKSSLSARCRFLWPRQTCPATHEVHKNALRGVHPKKVSAEVPTFWTVTVCGLSTLVEPTAVAAKISLGGIEKFSFNTELYFGKPE